ncbi:MAG: prepilin-type N-terminal cleavage/methylation domain-containing protein [bacterium]
MIKKKRKNKPSFTLLELLVSMSLASFVLTGLMESYHQLVKFMDRGSGIMITNRKVCLFFNQIERDFITAFIPEPQEEIVPEKEGLAGKAKQEKPKEKPKDRSMMTPKEKEEEVKKKLEERSKFFLGTSEEGESIKIDGVRYDLFKNATIISTNSLQVYGEKRVRFVRIMYELVKNKEMSKKGTKGEVVYDLIRKETINLKNEKMKVSEFAHDKKEAPIRTHVVAEGLKGVYLRYFSFKKPEKASLEKQRKKELEEIKTFSWGDKDYTKGIVPQRVELHAVFWSDDLKYSKSFHIIIPILSYPTEVKDEDEEAKKKKEQEQQGVMQDGQGPGAQGQGAIPSSTGPMIPAGVGS